MTGHDQHDEHSKHDDNNTTTNEGSDYRSHAAAPQAGRGASRIEGRDVIQKIDGYRSSASILAERRHRAERTDVAPLKFLALHLVASWAAVRKGEAAFKMEVLEALDDEACMLRLLAAADLVSDSDGGLPHSALAVIYAYIEKGSLASLLRYSAKRWEQSLPEKRRAALISSATWIAEFAPDLMVETSALREIAALSSGGEAEVMRVRTLEENVARRFDPATSTLEDVARSACVSAILHDLAAAMAFEMGGGDCPSGTICSRLMTVAEGRFAGDADGILAQMVIGTKLSFFDDDAIREITPDDAAYYLLEKGVSRDWRPGFMALSWAVAHDLIRVWWPEPVPATCECEPPESEAGERELGQVTALGK